MTPVAWPVLVVDDDATVLKLTEMLLSRLRIDGRTLSLTLCASADEARRRLSRERFALAIIDVVMETEHAGLDLVRELRADPRHAITPVVIRTGQAGHAPEAQVLSEYRINDFWRKDDMQPQRIRAAVTGLVRSYETALDLEERTRERDDLLREMHHRVKNNFQVITSMLRVQRDRASSAETRQTLDKCVGRLHAMVLAHHQLQHQDGHERVDLSLYLGDLAGTMQGMAPEVGFELEATPLEVPFEQAVSLGMIIHELVSNACEHGRRSDAEALRVRVSVERQGDVLRVEVRDDGLGFADDFNLARATSMGLSLVKAFTSRLRGEVTFGSERGARVVVTARVDARDLRELSQLAENK